MNNETCDLCSADRYVSWVWETPNPASSLAEAEAQNLPWIEDPEWAVCDHCHEHIVNDNLKGLTARIQERMDKMLLLAPNEQGVYERLVPDYEAMARNIATFWAFKTTFRELV